MDQMSLFDITEEHQGLDAQTDVLKVVKAQFKSVESVNWKDLFNGFSEIYAITYSAGIDFISKVMDVFDYGEIIFGCENVVDDNIAAIMAVQASLIETITKRKSAAVLARKMEEEKLKLFVSRDVKSHEKIFCLKSADGRKRVITGSANLSASAFCGYQRENICCFDGDEAYEWFMERFEAYREICSDNIDYKTIVATTENSDYLRDEIEEIPVAKTAVVKRQVFLEPSDNVEECELVSSVKGLEADLKPMLPKPQKERGKVLLTSEHVRQLKTRNKEQREEKKIRQRKMPQLHLDYDSHALSFNRKEFNMHPDQESIELHNIVLKDIKMQNQAIAWFEFSCDEGYFYLTAPGFERLEMLLSKNKLDNPMEGRPWFDNDLEKLSFIEKE